MKNGLLLVNLGTPDAPSVSSIRTYFRTFLADKRVISLPAPLRYLLLYLFILPFKAPKSAKAYQAIWQKQGSPLLLNSLEFLKKLQYQLKDTHLVALGMRYGNPSLKEALNTLEECENITILPLYPQYASATTGSSLEQLFDLFAKKNKYPQLKIISSFYDRPAYIQSQANLIKRYLKTEDFLLFSYHGLPERHLVQAGCLNKCQKLCPPITQQNQACYRAQCQETTEHLAKALSLPTHKYSYAFQSRLGKTAWIKPYTDEILIALANGGIKHLSIYCPSFVADCVETLEEIGIRAQHQWLALGGETFTLIPCLNDDDFWVREVAAWVG